MWAWLCMHIVSIIVASLIAWRLYTHWGLNDFNIFLLLFAAIGGIPIFVTGHLIWSSEYVTKNDPWQE